MKIVRTPSCSNFYSTYKRAQTEIPISACPLLSHYQERILHREIQLQEKKTILSLSAKFLLKDTSFLGFSKLQKVCFPQISY